MTYVVHVGVLVGLFWAVAMSGGMMVERLGRMHLGLAAIFGIGAYLTAILSTSLGLSVWLAATIAIVAAGVVSALLAALAIRLRGDYFALMSLAFQLCFTGLANNMSSLTGGPLGIPDIPGPTLFGAAAHTPPMFGLLLTPIIAGIAFLVVALDRSTIGTEARARRDNPILFEAAGMNPLGVECFIFLLSGTIIGLLGALYALYARYIDPTGFDLSLSILLFAIIRLSGTRVIVGTFFGALLLVAMPEALQLVDVPSYLAGHIRESLVGILVAGFVAIKARRTSGDHYA